MAKPLTPAQRGSNAVASLPAILRVGPFEIAIVKWPTSEAHASARWGEFSPYELTIRVKETMPSSIKAVDTFLHEATHALFWLFDMSDGLSEERIVGHLGTGLTQLHRDNPWLAPWIAEHTR